MTEDDILVHDETNHTMAVLLAALAPPHFTIVIGVIYCNPGVAYEQAVHAQAEQAAAQSKLKGNRNALLRAGATWTVGG